MQEAPAESVPERAKQIHNALTQYEYWQLCRRMHCPEEVLLKIMQRDHPPTPAEHEAELKDRERYDIDSAAPLDDHGDIPKMDELAEYYLQTMSHNIARLAIHAAKAEQELGHHIPREKFYRMLELAWNDMMKQMAGTPRTIN